MPSACQQQTTGMPHLAAHAAARVPEKRYRADTALYVAMTVRQIRNVVKADRKMYREKAMGVQTCVQRNERG